MILVYLLIIGCVMLAAGIGIGSVLKISRISRQNKEMEAILKQYGKDKATESDGGNTAD